MVLKNKDEFWQAIIGDSRSFDEKLYKVLSARGFLLEYNDGTIKVLDNNHVDDFDYLNEILEKLKIGYVEIVSDKRKEVMERDKHNGDICYCQHIVKEGKIVILDKIEMDRLIDEVLITERIDFSCIGGGENPWMSFLDRVNGEKVPVKVLETYIARFIKGLSSCGLATCRSCDGNHKVLADKVWLDFDTKANDIFYNAICKQVLNKKFSYNYGFEMPLYKENQYQLYYKLNLAGGFLFNNREYFRKVKNQFRMKYNSKYLKKKDNSERLEADFTEYLETAFDNFEKECK